MEPPIKDTPNKGHLSIKNKTICPNSYYTCTFQPPNKGNLSLKDKNLCLTCPLFGGSTVLPIELPEVLFSMIT